MDDLTHGASADDDTSVITGTVPGTSANDADGCTGFFYSGIRLYVAGHDLYSGITGRSTNYQLSIFLLYCLGAHTTRSSTDELFHNVYAVQVLVWLLALSVPVSAKVWLLRVLLKAFPATRRFRQDPDHHDDRSGHDRVPGNLRSGCLSDHPVR